MENPKLVSAVDFLAVHILPYWEGVAPEDAVNYTLEKIDLLRKTYPGKRIVVCRIRLAEPGLQPSRRGTRPADPGRR